MRLSKSTRNWGLTFAITVTVCFGLYRSTKSNTKLLPSSFPATRPSTLPRIQHDFTQRELNQLANTQRERRNAVKEAFKHAWSGYKRHAWLKDEVTPISGKARDAFGGLAATLVDALDSLWIFGLLGEFEEAVKAVASIDFSKPNQETLSVFEYNIRYLGGLLGAYEISERRYPVLLEKAIEMGELLYLAFDTPNSMPVRHLEWNVSASSDGRGREASDQTLLADLGTLTLEFTTLSRLSKEPKYHDAIQRVTDMLQDGQNTTKLPGMWPVVVDARKPSFSGHNAFTLGAMSDSLYEYLPKQHQLMGVANSQYLDMYENCLGPITKQLLFRPMTKSHEDILFSGTLHIQDSGQGDLEPMVQHLGCFAGGMLALGARLMHNDNDLRLARKLTDGCIWAYNSTMAGVMPEVFHVARCLTSKCQWNENDWHSAIAKYLKATEGDNRSTQERVKSEILEERLTEGYTRIDASEYILRPEAIESVFYLYRITGDSVLLDKGWDMFTAISKITHTPIANSAVKDVTIAQPEQTDRMESFWLAETLKYFFLIFSDPGIVSLDEYVLNTEAHPFKIDQS